MYLHKNLVETTFLCLNDGISFREKNLINKVKMLWIKKTRSIFCIKDNITLIKWKKCAIL